MRVGARLEGEIRASAGLVGENGEGGSAVVAARRRRGERGDGGEDPAVVAADLVKRLGLGGWSWKEENLV